MLTLLLVVFVQNYLKARANLQYYFNISKKNASKHVAEHVFEAFLTIQFLKNGYF
jgi:hypothetical protein